MRTDTPQGIVSSFLVGTADDSIGKRDRLRSVRVDELSYLTRNALVRAYVDLFGNPAFKRICFGAFGLENAYGDLGGSTIVGTVERHGRHREPSEAPTRSLHQ